MKILFTIEISGEPAQIFTWIDNPEKAMRWQKGVKKGKIIKETPERVGTTFIEEMENGAKSLEMRGVITGYIKNKMIAFQLESKIHIVDVRYSLSGKDGKTVIRMESDIRWKFPMNVVNIILSRKVKKRIENEIELEFAELKKLCEEGNGKENK